MKSATVTNVLKPATTETGLVVQVPSFIDEGDVIRVDTETGAYVSRVEGRLSAGASRAHRSSAASASRAKAADPPSRPRSRTDAPPPA